MRVFSTSDKWCFTCCMVMNIHQHCRKQPFINLAPLNNQSYGILPLICHVIISVLSVDLHFPRFTRHKTFHHRPSTGMLQVSFHAGFLASFSDLGFNLLIRPAGCNPTSNQASSVTSRPWPFWPFPTKLSACVKLPEEDQLCLRTRRNWDTAETSLCSFQ